MDDETIAHILDFWKETSKGDISKLSDPDADLVGKQLD